MNHIQNHYPESSSVIASPTSGTGGGSSSLQMANYESHLEHLTNKLKRLMNVAEYSSAAATPCLPANDFDPVEVSLESYKGLADGLSSQRLQGPHNYNQPFTTHGTTSATGSHNSSFRHNTRRSNGSYGSNIHNNVNGGPHHHHRLSNQNYNTHVSSHGRNFHRAPSGWRPPPPLPPPPLLQPPPYSYTPYYPGPQDFPRPLVMPPMQPYGFPYGLAASDLGYNIPYHNTHQLPPHPPNPCIGATPNQSFVGTTYYVDSTKDYSVNGLTSGLDLPHEIVKQVNYYFSIENLAHDMYLRKQMDHEAGWVPITLIAGFPRMKRLTSNVQIIVNALQASSVVEISDDDKKIRRRGDWERWILR